MCQAAGWKGPLHQCSVFGSKAAGEKLERMLALGASRPWPNAYRKMTGQGEADASALLEYFAPLRAWLERETRGLQCGW
jgi:peptidyl-dipeptidase A